MSNFFKGTPLTGSKSTSAGMKDIDHTSELIVDISDNDGVVVGDVSNQETTINVELVQQGQDGAGIEFVWRGTELGLRVEGDTEYTYMDLTSGMSIDREVLITTLGFEPAQADLLQKHLDDLSKHITPEERIRWNEGVNVDEIYKRIADVENGAVGIKEYELHVQDSFSMMDEMRGNLADTIKTFNKSISDLNEAKADRLKVIEQLDGKANKIHNHDALYASKIELDEKIKALELVIPAKISELEDDIEIVTMEFLESLKLNDAYDDIEKLKLEKAALSFVEEQVLNLQKQIDAITSSISEGDIAQIKANIESLKASKVDKVEGKGLSSNDLTDILYEKLLSVEKGANNYKHPDTHSAEMIIETPNKRFVSDFQKDLWNNKADKTAIPTKTSQLVNDSGYATLDDIPNLSGEFEKINAQLSLLGDTKLSKAEHKVAIAKLQTQIDNIDIAEETLNAINEQISKLDVDKADKSELAKEVNRLEELIASISVPTKVSELVNDAGYITSADKSITALKGDIEELKLNKADNIKLTSEIARVEGIIAGLDIPEEVDLTPITKAITQLETGKLSIVEFEKRLSEEILALIGEAPETLDTLGELAKALGEDPNFATTMTNMIAKKVSTDVYNAKIAEIEDTIENLDIPEDVDLRPVYAAIEKLKTETVQLTDFNEQISKLATISSVTEQLALKADRTELPKKLSELLNDTGFITKSDIPVVDLEPLKTDITALKTEKVDKESIPTKLSQLANDSGYIKIDDVPETDLKPIETRLANVEQNKANKTDIPTKVGQLTNDKGYITLAQVPEVDLTPINTEINTLKETKANQATLDNAINSVNLELAKKALKTDIPTMLSQLINDSKFITLEEVPEIDLSEINSSISALEDNKASKTELSGHTGNVTNPHKVTKAQIGLDNVDNTSDKDKPVSKPTEERLKDFWGKEELKIGGRNLIGFFNTEAKTWLNTDGSTITLVSGFLSDYIDVDGAQFITATQKHLNLVTVCGIGFYDENKTFVQRVVTNKKYLTLEIPSNVKYVRYTGKSPYGTYDEGIKLEKGNVATDWTPAPEDIQAQIDSKADKTEIPTKVSELVNDTNFITVEQVPDVDLSGIESEVSALSQNKADKTSIPTKVSDLSNDSKFITLEEVPEVDLSPLTDDISQLKLTKASVEMLETHTSNVGNPHKVTKAQVGLSKVDNTSDLNKPISNATKAALELKADKTNIPSKLSQLENDSKYITLAEVPETDLSEVENSIAKLEATKANKSEVDTHIANVDNPHKVTKAQIGLENVDNTKDVDKPISTPTKTYVDKGLATKQNTIGYTPEDVANKGKADGYTPLDANAKVPLQYIPDIAKQQTYVVETKEEMDKLSKLITGEKCYVTGIGDSYIWNGTAWQVLSKADWENVNLDWENITNRPKSSQSQIDGAVADSHKHANKTVLDKITDAMLSKIEQAFSHISDAVKHITGEERKLWNTVSNKADKTELTTHTSNASNPHKVTKGQVGLGNVDNTSDTNKPISVATQKALDTKANKVDVTTSLELKVNKTDVPTKVSQLSNDSKFITLAEVPEVDLSPINSNITKLQSGKADKTELNSHTGNKDNPHGVTKTQIGLGKVDNTSDAEILDKVKEDYGRGAWSSTRFMVHGDPDKFYPVVVEGMTMNNAIFSEMEIFRSYSWQAPSWNTDVHKGGVNIRVKYALQGWGGNTYNMSFYVGQTYANVVADIQVPQPDTTSMIYFLRGGGEKGAMYEMRAQENLKLSVHDGVQNELPYIRKPGTHQTEWHEMDKPAEAFDFKTGTIEWLSSEDNLYVGGGYRNIKDAGRIYHTRNKPTAADVGAYSRQQADDKLNKKADKTELPTKLSELTNDTKFITFEEVPETDLTQINDDINTLKTAKADKTFVTEELNKKANKVEIPTKVSQLTNDSKYITLQDVPKTDLTEVNSKLNALDTNKASKTELSSHTNSTANPHKVTKAQVGLGNVNNTSDVDKPISKATQTALNSKADKTSIPTKVSQLQNDSGFDIIEDAITKTKYKIIMENGIPYFEEI